MCCVQICRCLGAVPEEVSYLQRASLQKVPPFSRARCDKPLALDLSEAHGHLGTLSLACHREWAQFLRRYQQTARSTPRQAYGARALSLYALL